IVIDSRCGFVTRTLISPGRNSTRRTLSSSLGGGLGPTSPNMPSPTDTNTATAPTSAMTGSSAQSRQRAPPSLVATEPDSISVTHGEVAHPAELRELALVRVEHERPGVVELELDDPALAL